MAREHLRLAGLLLCFLLVAQVSGAGNCTRQSTCSNRGICTSSGTCVCDVGYNGTTCNSCIDSESSYPTCFVLNPDNGHRYYLELQQQYSWSDAVTYAAYYEEGSYLATVTTANEKEFVRTTFSGLSNFWLSGGDYRAQGSWFWNSGPENSIVFYTVLDSCTPGLYCNFGTFPPVVDADQGLIVDATGTWLPYPTSTIAFFLVEVGGLEPNISTTVVYNPINFHYYKYTPGALTWYQAYAAAASDNYQGAPGYLATVTTPEENNFLFNSFGGVAAYLGASDAAVEGRWQWLEPGGNLTFWEGGPPPTGVCVTFCLWNSEEPNNGLGTGDEDALVAYFYDSFGIWNDIYIQTPRYGFITEFDCSREITCGGHGNCTAAGVCACDFGYTGSFCAACSGADTTADCYIVNPATGHGYRLVQGTYNWQAALSGAASAGGRAYLATITSKQERDFINSTFHGTSFWVSGSDYSGQGSWTWSAGPEQAQVFYHVDYNCIGYCNFGTPPTGRGAYLGIMVDIRGNWVATRTSVVGNYLIEVGGSAITPAIGVVFNPNNTRFYQQVSATGLSWDNVARAARNSANQFQGTTGFLATVTTPQEHNFLVNTFGQMYAYLGAADYYQNGVWTWITRENSTFYQNGVCTGFCLWGVGQPNDTSGIYGLTLNTQTNVLDAWSEIFHGALGPTSYIVEYICARATTCGGNGDCYSDGTCTCDSGFTGPFCEYCNYGSYPNCYIENNATGHLYTILPYSFDFLGAWSYLEFDGIYLATITSQEEQDFIYNTFGNQTYWIGGGDYTGSGAWNWVDGPEKPSVFYHVDYPSIDGMYTNFATPPTGRGNALAVQVVNGTWVATPIGTPAYMLVEIGGDYYPDVTPAVVFNNYTNHYYQLVDANINWETAYALAFNSTYYGAKGYLATITSPLEFNLLPAQWGEFSAYLGGSDDGSQGTWGWLEDGTTFWVNNGAQQCQSFCMWDEGQPSSYTYQTRLAWNNQPYSIGDWSNIDGTQQYALDGTSAYIVEYDCDRTTICGNHGDCSSTGNCTCDVGYTGSFCRECAAGSTQTDCFIINPDTGHGYRLVSSPLEFQDAWDSAQTFEDGSYLATITSVKEQNFIASKFPGVNFWTSGADYGGGSWSWTAGPEKSTVFYHVTENCLSYCNFGQNAPTTRIQNGLMFTTVGTWNPTPFITTAAYLVEIGGSAAANPYNYIFNPANTHFYYLVPYYYDITWTEAYEVSVFYTFEDTPGYLATIDSPEEQNFITKTFGVFNAFVGGSDSATPGTWTWVTEPQNATFYQGGECVGFCMWSTGSPDVGEGLDSLVWTTDPTVFGDWRAVNNRSFVANFMLLEYECARETTCGGFGDCNKTSGTCVCDVGYTGNYCRQCSTKGIYPACHNVNPANGHAYFLSTEMFSFEDSWNDALDNYGYNGYLATITSQSERDYIAKQFPGVSFWIAGSDPYAQGSWAWVSGPEKSTVFYNPTYGCIEGMYCNFGPYTPTIRGPPRAIVVNNASIWVPTNITDDIVHYYLVEVGGSTPYGADDVVYFNPDNSHFYQLNYEYVPWATALTYAAESTYLGMTGYLATVTTPQEHNFLYNSFGEVDSHLGGSDGLVEGTWRWVTDENTIFWQNGVCLTFCLWDINQPTNDGVNGQNGLTWSSDYYTLADWTTIDTTGYGPYSYIVEYECARETTCSGHGSCSSSGTCACDAGYGGPFCRNCAQQGIFPVCFFTNPDNGHGYALVPTPLTWADAWTESLAGYGGNAYLATVTSQTESDFLVKTFPDVSYWISGGDFGGTGTWSWNSGPEKPLVFYHSDTGCSTGSYCNFGASGPTREANRYARGIMVDASGLWLPLPVTSYAFYIIEIGGVYPQPNLTIAFNPANFHWYMAVNISTNWDTALNQAAALTYQYTPGYLATVTSADEHNFIWNSFGQVDAFLGGSDAASPGTWRWVSDDNSIFFANGVCTTFCMWGISEPDDVVGDDYGMITQSGRYDLSTWTDASNSDFAATFIVEFECARTTTCGNHGSCTTAGICACDLGWNGTFCRSCSIGGTYPLCSTPPTSTGHSTSTTHSPTSTTHSATTAYSTTGSSPTLPPTVQPSTGGDAIQGGGSSGLSSGGKAGIAVAVISVAGAGAVVGAIKLRNIRNFKKFREHKLSVQT